MSMLSLSEWLATEQGRYVAGWEQTRVGAMVGDVFGFNALQIGLPEIDFLAENRIPLRQRIGEPAETGRIDVRCALPALPFAAGSIDLVVLAHTLEFHQQPHQLLREVERVLIAEGQVVIVGFNPFSLWGVRRHLPHCREGAPWNGRYIGLPRLKDWLELLSFDIDRGHFGRYAPPLENRRWLDRFAWMEKAGDRWWPIAGGIYVIRAVKRVHGVRLVKPKWKAAAAAGKALTPVARREQPHA
jgi:SAM-dependent methyltransferase